MEGKLFQQEELWYVPDRADPNVRCIALLRSHRHDQRWKYSPLLCDPSHGHGWCLLILFSGSPDCHRRALIKWCLACGPWHSYSLDRNCLPKHLLLHLVLPNGCRHSHELLHILLGAPGQHAAKLGKNHGPLIEGLYATSTLTPRQSELEWWGL